MKKSVLIDWILKHDKRLAELNQFQCQDHKNLLSKMVQEYEKNNIATPVPKPRTIRTNITFKDKALSEFTKSFKISIRSDNNALKQLRETRKAIFHMLRGQLLEMKGLKFVETLKITFSK